MNFITFDKLNDCIYKNIVKLPRDIDLVVGIPRSGMLTANIIGLYLNLPISDLDSFLDGRLYQTGSTSKCGHWITSADQVRHVLIIDDSINAGGTMKRAREKLGALSNRIKMTFCAIYALPTNIRAVDIYFEICNHPRMFEWNYMHHWGLRHACSDIDGVLCENPALLENIGSKRYEIFLRDALPKFLPSQPVGCLLTCRREKYREQTEDWLERHGVRYDHLIMLKEEDECGRAMTNADYGRFKGAKYRGTDCFIFLESSMEQAAKICEVSQRQVFCVENRTLLTPENVGARIAIARRDMWITGKRVMKKLAEKFLKNNAV